LHTCREAREAREARDVLFGATRIGEDHVLERNVPRNSLQRAAHEIVARVNHYRPIGSLDDGHGGASRFCERCQCWFHLPQTLRSDPGTCPFVILYRTVSSEHQHVPTSNMFHACHTSCSMLHPATAQVCRQQHTDRQGVGRILLDCKHGYHQIASTETTQGFRHSTVASRCRPCTRIRMSVIRTRACPM
jgi:hypothetical protein